jgi:hypothetical protein
MDQKNQATSLRMAPNFGHNYHYSSYLWTLSGIMHPFMAHFFKPIANRFTSNHHQTGSIAIDVEEVYKKTLKTSKLSPSNLNDKTYYQVKTESEPTLFDAATAQKT